MKKLICLLAFVLSATCICHAQNLSEENFNKLISYLQQEDWQPASALSKHYIDPLPKTEEAEASLGVLRYMYITSQAGLMNDGKLTQKDALKSIKNMEGKLLILPWRKFNNEMGADQYSLSESRPNTLFCNHTNKANTSIFCFEYYQLKEPMNNQQFMAVNGQQVRMRGKIKLITVEGNILPRFRMEITDAEFHGRE